jgi:glutathione S-transferase
MRRAAGRRWASSRKPGRRARPIAAAGELGRIRLVKMLALIATELHKPFIRVIFPTSDAEEEVARKMIARRARFPRRATRGALSVRQRVQHRQSLPLRDPGWARMKGVDGPEPFPAFFDRMEARPAVQLALQHEGLS